MHGTHDRKFIIIAFLSILLGGCNAGEEEDDVQTDVEVENRITGSVGDGPVVSANMRVLKKDGTLLVEFVSDATASFDVSVKTKGGNYPLKIEASAGTDLVTNLVPDFTIIGVVPTPGKKSVANLNPFTTFMYEMAGGMSGGQSKENLVAAENVLTTVLNSGLTSLKSSGPSSTQIDSSNITEIVKASEALGEVIRRTRDNLEMFNYASSGDSVIQKIASDLVDSSLDGRGGNHVGARTSAIFIAANTQVMLEYAANELHVNGVDATAAMASAIERVNGGAPDETLSEQTVTVEMLEAIRVGLAAIYAATGNPQIAQLQDAAGSMQAGMGPGQVRNLLPADYRSTMTNAVIGIAGGDDETIATVNTVAAADSGGTTPTNSAPQISGTPATSVGAGNNYSFTPAASDPDGDALTFSISGRPSWASFSSTTGRLSGVPAAGDAGTHSNIVISVSDGVESASLPAFSITVNATTSNSAPTISGSPPSSVTAGDDYRFTPSASDPDGDTLTFSISNKPSWASFNAANGALTGTPGAADVGVYNNIRITVSDGTESATLGRFSITVNAVSLGSVSLSWTAPTENEDGSALTDLAGYRIYWGTASGEYTNSVSINNPGLTTYVVEDLAPGSYEFVATSLNSSGMESVYSNSTIKSVP